MPAEPHWTALTTTYTAALTLAVYVGLVAHARTRHRAWAAREITPVVPWSITEKHQALGAAIAGAAAGWAWGPPAAIAASALGWLFVLAVITDLGSYKIPYDAITPVACIGLACFLADFTRPGLLSLASALVMVVAVPLAASLAAKRAIGMSDIRLLWATTATTSWWAGPVWLVYGLMAACLIQVLVRLATLRSGWGRVTAATAPTGAHEHDTSSTRQQRLTSRIDRRPRRELPFAPALVTGLVAMLLIASATDSGACATWSASGVC